MTRSAIARALAATALASALTSVLTSGLAGPLAAQDSTARTARPVRPFLLGIDPAAPTVWRAAPITGDRQLGGAGLTLRGGYVASPRFAVMLDATLTDVRVDGVTWEFFSMDLLLRLRRPRAFAGGRLGWFVDAGGAMFDATRDAIPASGPRIDQWTGPGLVAGAGLTWHVRECWTTVLAVHGERGHFDDHRVGMTTTHGLDERVETSRVSLGLDLSPPGTC